MNATAPELNLVEPLCRGLRERPDLETMFAPRREGYLGADVALSIPLPSGDVLWLFGDTLMGSHDGQRRQFGDMPRNTAALQLQGAASSDAIRWLHRPNNEDFFSLPPHAEERWFWPGTGFVIQDELFVFGYGVSRSVAEHEALSFRLDAPWVIRVRDLSGDPLDWKYEAKPIANAPSNPWFCSACCIEGMHVYFLGFGEAGTVSGHRMEGLVARTGVADLLAGGDQLEFWSGAKLGWRKDANEVEVTHNPGVSECTLLFDAPRQRYIATTYRAHKGEFYAITAPHPRGPWSEAKPLFRLPYRNGEHGALGYAFRMHPHLPGEPGEMAFSYLVNTYSPAALVDDLSLYYPRFISIPLASI